MTAAPARLPTITTPSIMLTVLIALLPAIAVQVWLFGADWTLLLLAACGLAFLLEALFLWARGHERPLIVQDGSALITAVLLLLILPDSLQWWQAGIGIVVAISVGKHVFGGLGQNLFNPVAVSYLALMALFPQVMTTGNYLLHTETLSISAILAIVALLPGGLWLLRSGIVSWHIPLGMTLTTVLLFHGFGLSFSYYLLLLMALFVATDPVTSPGTRTGKLVYGCLVSLISAIMVLWLAYPVAVAAAIVCGNAFTPTLDQLLRQEYGAWKNRGTRW